MEPHRLRCEAQSTQKHNETPKEGRNAAPLQRRKRDVACDAWCDMSSNSPWLPRSSRTHCQHRLFRLLTLWEHISAHTREGKHIRLCAPLKPPLQSSFSIGKHLATNKRMPPDFSKTSLSQTRHTRVLRPEKGGSASEQRIASPSRFRLRIGDPNHVAMRCRSRVHLDDILVIDMSFELRRKPILNLRFACRYFKLLKLTVRKEWFLVL